MRSRRGAIPCPGSTTPLSQLTYRLERIWGEMFKVTVCLCSSVSLSHPTCISYVPVGGRRWALSLDRPGLSSGYSTNGDHLNLSIMWPLPRHVPKDGTPSHPSAPTWGIHHTCCLMVVSPSTWPGEMTHVLEYFYGFTG